MVDKMKGKEIQDASTSVNDRVRAAATNRDRSGSASINPSQPGETYATDEQPLWKEIQVVTKASSGGGNVRFLCRHCQTTFVGSYTRVKAHLLKLPGFGIRACKNVSTYQAREFKRVQDRVEQMQRKTIDSTTAFSMPPTIAEKKRKTIDSCFKVQGRAELDRLAAQHFYASCIPFNVARSPYWKKFVTAVANSNLAGYVPPGSEKLRTSLLQDQRVIVERGLSKTKLKWQTTGVSIVSDGWTDIQRRPLINFIAFARDEPVFLRAVDASGEFKDAEYLKSLFVDIIEQVGPDNVVQLITDNAPVCKSAGLSLRSQFPHIFWTPCVAHTLNLALKDICHPPSQIEDPEAFELFSWIEDIERDARNIRNFVVNHQHALSIFDSYSDLRLLRVGETRFASIIIVLKRIARVRDALIQMVVSRDWSFYRSEDEAKAQAIKNIILSDEWWSKIEFFLQFTEPIWCMLREVDKDEPMLHKVYEMWDVMIEEVQSIVLHKEKNVIPFVFDSSAFFARIHKILVDRWDKSNTPLHCMAHALNPKYYAGKWLLGAPGRIPPNLDNELSKNRRNCQDRLFIDAAMKKQAMSEYTKFSLGEFCFEGVEAREDEDINPFDWWSTYGDEFPVLKTVAFKLLSQPVSSSCCERNWSTYSHIHNIKRNKLTNKRAEDLVYVHSNLRLLSRKERNYSCGPSKYWDVEAEDFDFEGDLNLRISNIDLDDPDIPCSSHVVEDDGNDESIDDTYQKSQDNIGSN